MIETVIERALEIYRVMPHSAAIDDALRAKLANYLKILHETGETEPRRLMVFGLIYLRESDGPRPGLTGL